MMFSTLVTDDLFLRYFGSIILGFGISSDAWFYSNLSTKIFLRACLFCLDPDCCKNRFHPGTCVYSNLETKTLLQQSRDPKCYSNLEPVHSGS